MTDFHSSGMTLDEYLEHYGVKGMKWGVRRKLSGHIKTRSARSQKGTASNFLAPNGYNEIYTKKKGLALQKTLRKARRSINKGTRILNKDPRFKGQDFRKDSPLRREYYNAFSKMVETQLNAASTIKGNSRRGEYRLHFKYDHQTSAFPEVSIKLNSNIGGRLEERKAARETLRTVGGLKTKPEKAEKPASDKKVVKVEAKKTKSTVKHADEDDATEYVLPIVWGDMGEILEIGEIDVAHADTDDEVLMHYGVKGMKWGIRRPVGPGGLIVGSKGKSAPKATVSIAKKPVPKKAAPAAKKTSSPEAKKPKSDDDRAHAMTTAELQAKVARLQLERQYVSLQRELAPRQEATLKQALAKSVREGMQDATKELVKQALVKGVTKGVAKAITKK